MVAWLTVCKPTQLGSLDIKPTCNPSHTGQQQSVQEVLTNMQWVRAIARDQHAMGTRNRY
jgi:hypothetical protein